MLYNITVNNYNKVISITDILTRRTFKKDTFQHQNKINRLTMDQLVELLLVTDKAHTAPQRVLDCGPDIGGLLKNLYSHHQII